MPKRSGKLSDEIRDAIRSCGVSRYRIAKELSVSEGLLSKFMHKRSGLSMETLDALAGLLDLHIVAGRRQPRGRR